MGISWDITESKRAFDVRWLSAHLWSKKRRNCQGLPAPKELTLQSCLLDRASILMLQVVLPSALLLGPSSHQVWQGKRNEREKTWLKPIHLTRCCSPFKFCFCMSTILLHVSSIWAKYTMVDGFWFIHHSSQSCPSNLPKMQKTHPQEYKIRPFFRDPEPSVSSLEAFVLLAAQRLCPWCGALAVATTGLDFRNRCSSEMPPVGCFSFFYLVGLRSDNVWFDRKFF